MLLTYILRRFNIKSAIAREDLKPTGEFILRRKSGIMVDIIIIIIILIIIIIIHTFVRANVQFN